MRDDAIVAYKHLPDIDVEAELESLGDPFAEGVLLFCQRIVAGKDASGVDHWGLLPFDTYEGIPVYKFTHGSRYALLAVEDDGAGDRRVSLVLAGRTSAPVLIDGEPWDGYNIFELRSHFLQRRLRDYFQ